MRDDQHLRTEEITFLAEGLVHRDPETPERVDPSWAAAHVAQCAPCAALVESYRDTEGTLRVIRSEYSHPPAPECPAERSWHELAAGLVAGASAENLVQHAIACDHCGPLLRQAIEDLGPQISPDERRFIATLASAQPAWQHAIARGMAEQSQPPVSSRQLRETTRPPQRVTGWWAVRWVPRLAMTAVAILLLGLGTFLYLNRGASPAAARQLIAQAYSQQRTFPMRFEDASYGPLRQTRGSHDSTASHPQALLDAKVQIAQQLAQHPDDPDWLQAAARVDLLEGHPEPALAALQRAAQAKPDDRAIRMDLAIAYFENRDSQKSLELLNRELGAHPDNSAALFNRALIYESLNRNDDARVDWQRYLQLEPSGAWAEEAKGHLK